MKKIGAILIAIAILGFAGCASKPKSDGPTVEPYEVDLSTMQVVALDGTPLGETVKNPQPFTKNYDDLMILFPPIDLDWTEYPRITVTVKYFGADGAEINQGDGNAMVSLIYDITGNIRGPDMGPGPNTPMKEFNVGGYSGTVHKERGSRSRLTKAPQAILFQNSNVNVKFIEVTSIIFHNND